MQHRRGTPEAPAAKVSLSRLGAVTIVDPGVDVQVRALISLRPVFERLSAQGNEVLAVDLRKVSFIDSSGIGLITNLAKRLNAGGGKLYLFGCSRELRELLDMVGIQEVAPILRDVDELRSVTSGPGS